MKDKLKKGQAFIGKDNELYYYLGLNYNGDLFFTNLELWNENTQRYITSDPTFVKDILDTSSERIETCTWYYQSEKEFNDASLIEKIDRCIDIIRNYNTSDFKLLTQEFGPLVRGTAYNKEYNQVYTVIGFIVENSVYVDNKLYDNAQKGFFAIYHTNIENSVPLIFERGKTIKDNSFDGKYFIAGNNDEVKIEEVLCSQKDVKKCIEKVLKQLEKEEELSK